MGKKKVRRIAFWGFLLFGLISICFIPKHMGLIGPVCASLFVAGVIFEGIRQENHN